MTTFQRTNLAVIPMMALYFIASPADAGSITVQTFATGAAIGATSPDSVEFGDGSVWIAYQNGADSAGASGSSTVARYTPLGALLQTWSIPGNVDGLRVDPSTGLVWALQNNDGNSALTVINPTTNGTTGYTYGNTYTNVANRGFDDLAFLNGQMFLSETNPASPSDPVIVKLTSGLMSPLQVAPILTAGAITDPDSLIITPSGGLALTGEADQEIIFVQNPGAMNQTVTYLPLLDTSGNTISGLPDDTAYATQSQGLFYMADTGANIVYMITATGFTPGQAFVDVGDVFGSLNTTTGIVTPLYTGVSPHGVEFVTFAQAGIPEPGTAVGALSGLLLCAGLARLRRRA
jgi:hypothetical protein